MARLTQNTWRVAVTGVDGTGKTTVIRRLREEFRSRPDLAFAFRAPQYHEDEQLPFGGLSKAIDDLSVYGDINSEVKLKALALFLSMTLYGDVERHVMSAYKPRVMFAERQCLLDTLAYARFYLPMLAQAKDSNTSSLASAFALPKVIQHWLPVVAKREQAIKFDLSNLSQYLGQVFSGEPQAIVERLSRIFAAEIPNQIILLTANRENLQGRLAEKKSETPVAELHEQAGTLEGLLKALRESAALLKKIAPELEVVELPTDGLSIEETVSRVKQLSKLEEVVCD